MPFNMKDCMSIPEMSGARVLTASNTLISRPVEFISVIEIPVENFIRKNELVLTTAIGCNSDTKIFKEFIQDIYESEATALVISTGRHITSIPDNIIQYAESIEFPLIEIPWEIRFSDIMRSVLTEINNWHNLDLERNENIQKKLLNLYLEGSHLSDAAELFRRYLGVPVVIVNCEGSVKGKSNESEMLIEILNSQRVSGVLSIQDKSIKKYSIQSGNSLYGHMLILNTNETSFNNQINFLVRNITTIIALWFQREQSIRETKMRFRNDIIWSLAKGELDSWDMLDSQAKSIGYNISLPYICILGVIENTEDIYKNTKTSESSYEQWLYDTINLIEEQVIWSGKFFKMETLLTYQQESLIIFLESKKDNDKRDIDKFLDMVEARLKKFIPDIILSWGIGENHQGIRSFHDSYLDAKTALSISNHQKYLGHRFTYANTGLYRILMNIAENKETQEIVRFTIGAMLEYDKQRGMDLINTLKTYIQNQANVSKTARVLNLHRQSLLYRLKKIESLTNKSLDNPDDLFLIDFCIRLWLTGLIE